MKLKGLTHIGICVSSIEKTVDFYRNMFEFRLQGEIMELIGAAEDAKGMGVPGSSSRVAVIRQEEIGMELELIEFTAPEGRRSSEPMNTFGKYHIAYEVDDIQEYFAKAAEYGCKPVYKILYDEEMEIYWGYITDPDGTVIELTQKK